MCGRFHQSRDQDALARRFLVDVVEAAVTPTWNAAPTQQLPVVLAPGGLRHLRHLRLLSWGFRPDWSRRPLINAQAEHAATKRTFRDAWRQRRCLVPADGFYEWIDEGGRRMPVAFRDRRGDGLAFAGIWEAFAVDGEERACFAILTTRANACVAPVHGRMPAVLGTPAAEAAWLDPCSGLDDLARLCEPCGDDLLEAVRVGERVNDVRHDGPELLAALS